MTGDAVTIRPKRGAIITTVVLAGLIWVPGVVEMYLMPSDPYAWVAIGIAAAIIGYVATQAVTVENGRVGASRYFIVVAEADARRSKLVSARVGQPPILPGLAIVADDHQVIAELLPWNYAASDLEQLRTALSHQASNLGP